MVETTFLPTGLISVLTEIGAKLEAGEQLTTPLNEAIGLLADLNPGHVARAEREIADAAGLYRQPQQSRLHKLFSARPSAAAQLLRTPGLEYLFVFHRDGRVREAALLKITGGLPNPFLFAAILWRLNDWAEPVRQAAARCASRSFPLTKPDVIARTAADLLVRQATWRRWQRERSILDDAFGRRDVAAELANLMVAATTGPQASTLRYALRTSSLDKHLERLASTAAQPSVRAVALSTLIEGKAEWPSGIEWRWIDKSMGLRRREPVFAHRPVKSVLPRHVLIKRGLGDKSAIVRRVALTGVIRHMLGTPEGLALATPFTSDRSHSVREKAEFVLKHQQI